MKAGGVWLSMEIWKRRLGGSPTPPQRTRAKTTHWCVADARSPESRRGPPSPSRFTAFAHTPAFAHRTLTAGTEENRSAQMRGGRWHRASVGCMVGGDIALGTPSASPRRRKLGGTSVSGAASRAWQPPTPAHQGGATAPPSQGMATRPPRPPSQPLSVSSGKTESRFVGLGRNPACHVCIGAARDSTPLRLQLGPVDLPDDGLHESAGDCRIWDSPPTLKSAHRLRA